MSKFAATSKVMNTKKIQHCAKKGVA